MEEQQLVVFCFARALSRSWSASGRQCRVGELEVSCDYRLLAVTGRLLGQVVAKCIIDNRLVDIQSGSLDHQIPTRTLRTESGA